MKSNQATKRFEEMGLDELRVMYAQICELKLNLDMTRGKPAPAQMDLAMPLLDDASSVGYKTKAGLDCRNYGELIGITEARELFASLTGYDVSQIFVLGNSSITLMSDVLSHAMIKPLPSSSTPWFNLPKRKILCPCPGYDRHFQMAEYLGFELIPVPMKLDGPDIDLIEDLVANDSDIVAMWLVPVYSNPDGITTSPEVCKRLASMHTAALDFVLMWDMAYFMHHLRPNAVKESVPNILALCEEAGHPNRPFIFHSTSKMTFAGGGLASITASADNLAWFKHGLSQRSISPYKLIQLQHVAYMQNKEHTEAIMQKMADIIEPKFEVMIKVLSNHFKHDQKVRFLNPNGGYFVSVYLPEGTAKRAVELAAVAGVKITPAGNPFPYGIDPHDSHLRLAPTYPQIDDVAKATEIIALCMQIAIKEKEAE